ncbi:sensor histidine kinase [Thalassobellus citreus]|uniref:sensor histidine kinase n=1 Tax=Thalassobellus citreus TaxID=3367752 RepID=UPI003F6DFBC2
MIYFKSIGDRFVNDTWSYMFFQTYFIDYMLVIFFMSIVSIITKYLVVNHYKWSTIVTTHLLLSFSLGLFIFFGLVVTQTLLGSSSVQNLTFSKIIYYYINVLDLNFLIYLSIVVITHIYLNKKLLKENHIQKIELIKKLEQAKMEVLQSQIHPHFLFNTLNNIHTLIDIDGNKSKSMLVDLSDFLRITLDYKIDNLSELQDELTLLNKYINIIKIRFSKNLEIKQHIDNNLENVLLPTMLLQIIFENAIKHGYSQKNLKLKIVLSVKKINDKLLIIVENNGKPFPGTFNENLKKGLGLKNIHDRLQMLFKDNFSFNITNENKYVIVKIMLPITITEYSLS